MVVPLTTQHPASGAGVDGLCGVVDEGILAEEGAAFVVVVPTTWARMPVFEEPLDLADVMFTPLSS